MGRMKVTKEDLARNVLLTPAQWYRMLISKYEEKLSAGKEGKPKTTNHVFTLTVQADGDPEHKEYIGASMLLFFNEQALGAAGPFFAALGAEKDADGGYDVEPKACVGKEVEVYVTHRPDEKQPSKKYNSADEFRPLTVTQ